MGDQVIKEQRQLYIMRHAERVDFAIDSHWISKSFDQQGNYIRNNLNMPLSVPKRKGGPKDFKKDCPLTRIGLFQATLAGEGMKSSGVRFSHVFSSPSLRCIETCTNVLEASGNSHLPINIEPGLFEWLEWHKDQLPTWMSAEELKEHGFNVNVNYVPVITEEEVLGTGESCFEYYNRHFKVTKNVLKEYSGNILFVAHASSLDTCSRQLIGKEPRIRDLDTLLPAYTSVAVVELNAGSSWKLVEPPMPTLVHSNNKGFKWRKLLD